MASDGIHITSINHKKYIELTEQHAMVEGVPGVPMYPHQLTTISALRDIENIREFKIANTYIKTKAVRLANTLGSGKTHCIHGLVKLFPIPKAISEHLHISDSHAAGDANKLSQYFGSVHNGINEVIVRYKNFLRATIIIVGSSVMEHWIETAKRFGMRYFVIGECRDMRKFYEVFKAGNIDVYDEIIVKNGTITTNFTLDNEPAGSIPTNSIRSIIEVLIIMTREYCWARAVYDDFDTIRIPQGATTFPALFSIFVSATLNDKNIAKPVLLGTHWASSTAHNTTPGGIVDYILNATQVAISDVPGDGILHKCLSVRCSDKYLNDCIRMPLAFKQVYIYTHAGKLFMKMLDNMGIDNASEILEMINGDAINTAAGRLGIQTTSVAEIAHKVLNDNFDRYRQVLTVMQHIRKWYELINELPEHPDSEYSMAACDRIAGEIRQKKSPNVEYYSPGVLERIDVFYQEASVEAEKLSSSVKRVQDNIKDGECIVCLGQLTGCTIFISKCCSVVLCGQCLGKACRLQASDTKGITGMCPKCRVKINMSTDMIALDAGFDFNTLVEADPLAIEEPIPKDDEKKKMEEAERLLPMGELGAFADVANPKIRALLNIINGIPLKCQRREELVLNNLLAGQTDTPIPDGAPRRILVFASFDETLDNIKRELRQRQIPCEMLGGTYQQMAQTIRDFEKSGKVLLVNSTHYCAGVNLQFCTDLVFMHKIINDHCEQQVCGRAQRIGRKHNLTVHYLLYENERA